MSSSQQSNSTPSGSRSSLSHSHRQMENSLNTDDDKFTPDYLRCLTPASNMALMELGIAKRELVYRELGSFKLKNLPSDVQRKRYDAYEKGRKYLIDQALERRFHLLSGNKSNIPFCTFVEEVPESTHQLKMLLRDAKLFPKWMQEGVSSGKSIEQPAIVTSRLRKVEDTLIKARKRFETEHHIKLKTIVDIQQRQDKLQEDMAAEMKRRTEQYMQWKRQHEREIKVRNEKRSQKIVIADKLFEEKRAQLYDKVVHRVKEGHAAIDKIQQEREQIQQQKIEEGKEKMQTHHERMQRMRDEIDAKRKEDLIELEKRTKANEDRIQALRGQQIAQLADYAEKNLQKRIDAHKKEQELMNDRLEKYYVKLKVSEEYMQTKKQEKKKLAKQQHEKFEKKRLSIIRKAADEDTSINSRKEGVEKKDKKFEELWAQKRQLDEERRMLDFEMKRLQDERIERNMRRVHRQQLFREQEIKKKLEEENQRLQSLKELTRATQMEVEKQQVRMFLQKEQWRAKIRNLNHHTVMELHQSHFSEKGREEHR